MRRWLRIASRAAKRAEDWQRWLLRRGVSFEKPTPSIDAADNGEVVNVPHFGEIK